MFCLYISYTNNSRIIRKTCILFSLLQLQTGEFHLFHNSTYFRARPSSLGFWSSAFWRSA